MNNIKNYFLKGLLYIVPIAALCWVVYRSYVGLNDILTPYLKPLNLEYLGVVILFILITLVGYLGSVVIASPLSSFFRKLLNRAPLLKTIYSSVQDLMNTFVGDKKGFSEPVLVKVYENSTIERIGFVTNEDVGSLNIKKGKVLVYMPHSYAISGQLFVVEKKNITHIDKSSSDIMKLIISGGVTEIEE
ncbi:MAG: DUF502 domain-containing protein [Flavobacteriales bacterium]|mgnify:FL=1|jgi:uncharacterized membrane protein|nr:DUF502 domain-containing protein [Flavobacteriales bacterium]